MAFPQAQVATSAVIPSRTGTSPIGTSNPNTGSTGNTNSSYSPGAYTSGVNRPSGTSYTVQNTDYGGIVQFNTASAVSVTLNSSVTDNFVTSIQNLLAGAITLTTSDGSAINQGSDTLTLLPNQNVQVQYADGEWTAFIGATVIPTEPENLAPVAGVYVTGYNSGTFDVSSPAGISATITTAALTSPGGTQGSMTFVNGLLTAQTPAT